jgi:hypothetical protein
VLRYPSTHVGGPAPSKTMVVGAIHKVKDDVSGCFSRFRMAGIVEACFDVAPNGTPENIGSAGDLAGTEEARCVLQAMHKVRFEPVGEPYSFAYPVVLR